MNIPAIVALLLLAVPFCQKKLTEDIQADPAKSVKVGSGSLVRVDSMESRYIDPRPVDIWLPDGYTFTKRYPVLYLHDGQMLFDSTKTWNKQEWRVDETVGRLIKERKLPPMIIVAIWNNDSFRRSEYFPEAIADSIPEPLRSTILKEHLSGKPRAEAYLKFIVEELKPFIDRSYKTQPELETTFMGGSSMGGLISLYALCRYPDVFGGVMALSLHSPLVPADKVTPEIESDVIPFFPAFLAKNLPPANSRKIYIDYGDQTIDSLYKPYQQNIDAVLASNGWKAPWWETRFFPGTDHSEKAWAARFDQALLFITAP